LTEASWTAVPHERECRARENETDSYQRLKVMLIDANMMPSSASEEVA